MDEKLLLLRHDTKLTNNSRNNGKIYTSYHWKFEGEYDANEYQKRQKKDGCLIALSSY